MPAGKEQIKKEPAKFVEEAVMAFVSASPLNRMPGMDDYFIFGEPLVQFADGNDPLFAEYKSLISPNHLTPREALAKALGKNPQDMSAKLSVISWILPIASKTRASNRPRTKTPSRLWAYTRSYGENFNDALRKHMVALLTGAGYLAAAPMLQPYFKQETGAKGDFSNWSERHVAYAAGLGTFSLSDGFITERGIAHRCGSVVTDLELPPSPRTARDHYSNCLFYANGKCRACIDRCPVGAISESGHDKIKCKDYLFNSLRYLLKEYEVRYNGCGLCQTKVPCEFKNPAR